jgi:hypothetical protein
MVQVDTRPARHRAYSPCSGWVSRLSAAVLVVVCSSSARAEPREFEPAALLLSRSDDAADCPDEFEIARAIEARLWPGALVAVAEATLVVEASIRAEHGGGYHVEIVLTRGSTVVGRRELTSTDPSCVPIAEQAALVIALTIDPEASLLPPGRDAPAATPPPTPPPAPQTAAPKAPPPLREATPPHAVPKAWSGDLELATGVVAGIVPELTPGLFLRGRVRPPDLPLALELQAAYFPATDVELTDDRGADFTTFFMGTAACTRADRASRVHWSVCGGVDLAATTGTGYGFDREPRFWSWTLLLSTRGRLGFRATRGLSLALGPDLMLPFGRDRFVAVTPEGTEELFRMEMLGVGFELAGVWEL